MSACFTRHSWPVHIYCTVGAADFHALCKEWGRSYKFHRHPAAMIDITPSVVVVALPHSLRRAAPAEIAGMLAHEATHVCQWTMRAAAEHTPGDESEAYLVQALVEWMWKIVVDGAVN